MTSLPLKAEIERCVANHEGNGLYFSTAFGDVFVTRTVALSDGHHLVQRSALCVVVQGEMQVLYTDAQLAYGPMQAFAVGAGQPAYGKITKASPQSPFLGITVEFDAPILVSVMEQLGAPPASAPGQGYEPFIHTVESHLADCLARLVRVLQIPRALPVLHPSIMTEIAFWLLTGADREQFCKLAVPTAQTRSVSQAMDLIRLDLARPVRIADLAASVRMSESSFHHHFKTLTSMTPLQYQKRLRLIEARRLLEGGIDNVNSTAFRVGYQSPSQFSREYKRMFGKSPRRNVGLEIG